MVAENDQNLSLESKLGLLSFDWDSSEFIKVNTEICKSCEKKPCLYVCPSEVYTLNEEELVYKELRAYNKIIKGNSENKGRSTALVNLGK